MEVELAHQVGAVVVDRLDADVELGGDLLGAVALGHELEDLAFTVGEEIGAVARAGIGDDIAEESGDGGAEIGAAIRDGLEALLELDEAGGLFNKAVGADFEHFADEDGIFVARKNEDTNVWQMFYEAAEQVDTVQAGQFGVEDQKVGFYLKAQIESTLAVAAFTDEFIVFVESENLDQHLADSGLVLTDHKALHKCDLLVPRRAVFSTQTSAVAMNSHRNRRNSIVRCRLFSCLALGAYAVSGIGCATGGMGAARAQVPPPRASVTKSQAWRDAEALAALDPSRLTVIGSGASMRPVYGENTVLVLQRVPFDALTEGMNVAYRQNSGRVVLHRLVSRDGALSWRARGFNNEGEDLERVTPENLLGIVYAAFANDQVR